MWEWSFSVFSSEGVKMAELSKRTERIQLFQVTPSFCFYAQRGREKTWICSFLSLSPSQLFVSFSSLLLPHKQTSSAFVCSLLSLSKQTHTPHHFRHVSLLLLINVINWSAGAACQPGVTFVFLAGVITRILLQREAARSRYSLLISRLNSPQSISWWCLTVMNEASLLTLSETYTQSHSQADQ